MDRTSRLSSFIARVNRVNNWVTLSVFVVPKEKGVTFRFRLIIVTKTQEKS